MIYYISSELSHHGVKGMKWGVRKQRAVITRKKTRRYSDAYDKWSSAQDKADNKWREARKTYKSLGRTSIGRVVAVAKASKGKGASAAKKYLKQYGEWESLQNKADAADVKRKETRKALGKTWISRTFNSIKYR